MYNKYVIVYRAVRMRRYHVPSAKFRGLSLPIVRKNENEFRDYPVMVAVRLEFCGQQPQIDRGPIALCH